MVIWSKRRDYGYAIRNRGKVDHINLIQRLRQRTVNNGRVITHITHELIGYTRKINY